MNNLHDVVRYLAYQLWENAGRPQGRSDEFWFSAEEEIKRSLGETPAPKALIEGSETDGPASEAAHAPARRGEAS